MPWQMAPPLLIVGGCFVGVGYALQFVQWVKTGKPKRRMQNEYFFQMDRRDTYIENAKREFEQMGDSIKGTEVFERRETDYSRYQNTFNTYNVPHTNPYLEKLKKSEVE